MNPLNIFRKIATGVVTGKNHYAASGIQRQTDTNFDKGKDMVSVFVNTPATAEGWSLIVQGTDKSGKHPMTKEIYVDPMTWANTEIDDKWPIDRSKP